MSFMLATLIIAIFRISAFIFFLDVNSGRLGSGGGELDASDPPPSPGNCVETDESPL
jgi:hypothetical protein